MREKSKIRTLLVDQLLVKIALLWLSTTIVLLLWNSGLSLDTLDDDLLPILIFSVLIYVLVAFPVTLVLGLLGVRERKFATIEFDDWVFVLLFVTVVSLFGLLFGYDGNFSFGDNTAEIVSRGKITEYGRRALVVNGMRTATIGVCYLLLRAAQRFMAHRMGYDNA